MTNTILYLINALGTGGSERQLVYLLAGLNRSRFEPVICTIFDDETHPPHPAYIEQLNSLNIPRYTLAHGGGWSGRVAALGKLASLNWRLRPKIVHSFLHYANLLTRAARPVCPPHTLYTTARAIYLQGEIRSEAYTFWMDDLLICNAPHICQQVLEHTRRAANRVTFIPNGLAIERFSHNPDPELRQRLFGDVGFVLAYIGRIDSLKDLPTIIEALVRLPTDIRDRMRLFLLGEVSEQTALHTLERLIEQYALQSTIQLIASVAEVAPYYHAADVLVLPSLMEGMPNVVMEACAAGTPVIVSEGANQAGLVQNGVNGWQFKTGDANALAILIEQAYHLSTQRRFEMSRQARAVAEEYTVQLMVKRYTELYSMALKS